MDLAPLSGPGVIFGCDVEQREQSEREGFIPLVSGATDAVSFKRQIDIEQSQDRRASRACSPFSTGGTTQQRKTRKLSKEKVIHRFRRFLQRPSAATQRRLTVSQRRACRPGTAAKSGGRRRRWLRVKRPKLTIFASRNESDA